MYTRNLRKYKSVGILFGILKRKNFATVFTLFNFEALKRQNFETLEVILFLRS